MIESKFRFIDLFAGIGGFHVAMSHLGGQCVFASEIDEYAIETYRSNFGIDANHDITQTPETAIPKHEVLCAGFPCQAFSKAGKQNGFEDTRGTLFFDILRILRHHQPKYFLLENVRNLISHNGGTTWRVIHENLNQLGYLIPEKPIIFSPHQIGIPQLRERVFIPGVAKGKTRRKAIEIEVPKSKRNVTRSALILNGAPPKEFLISPYEEYVLQAWDEFLQGLNHRVVGFPIWVEEFTKEYDVSPLPAWEQVFVNKNRWLYQTNRRHIDQWLNRYDGLKKFVPTHTKFEWQAGTSIGSVWDGIIQFRPSGIRVKRPTEFPALVAMVHIPIIGWEKRRLTPREAANLQSFPHDFTIHPNNQQAYKQLGNSVNVEVIKYIAKQLFEY
ncbi:MAG TPA: DNA cytosine methyltransferase [Tenuifilaceae bacterium]|nr:DNA cytosine methyltransferase [Tenuifilaceae bacterium]